MSPPARPSRRSWAAMAGLGVIALAGGSLAGPAAAPVIGPFVPIVLAVTLGAVLLAVPRR